MRALLPLVLLVACESDQGFQDDYTANGAPAIAPFAVVDGVRPVKTGETVRLDGTASYDPDDDRAELRYSWKVVGAPEEGEATIEAGDTPLPTVSADFPGTYLFRLTVTDEADLDSVNDAIVSVEVLPYRDLDVELHWDQPDVDLDLHVIGPGGDYYTDGDCYFGNPEPDWGIHGDINDDPFLEEDDEGTGAGERMTLAFPPMGYYRVMVHYYSERNSGISKTDPVIRLSAEGKEVARIEGKRLNTAGQVLMVGQLRWANLNFEAINQIADHDGLGGPPYNE